MNKLLFTQLHLQCTRPFLCVLINSYIQRHSWQLAFLLGKPLALSKMS